MNLLVCCLPTFLFPFDSSLSAGTREQIPPCSKLAELHKTAVPITSSWGLPLGVELLVLKLLQLLSLCAFLARNGKRWVSVWGALFKCSRLLIHANHWEQLGISTVRNELFGKPALLFNLVRRQSDFLMKPNKLQVCQFLQKGKAFFNVLD